MDIGLNLETLQQCCRACLQKGEINIWDFFKVKMNQENDENGDFMDMNIIQLMDIFNNYEILDLTEEFPLLCCQCLEDLKFCYMFYEKIKFANIQLKNVYQETLNQCIEEEHLIESIEDEEKLEIIEIIEPDYIEKSKEAPAETIHNIPQHLPAELNPLTIEPKVNAAKNHSKSVPLDENAAFIITQFIPTTLDPPQRNYSNPNKQAEDEEYQPPKHLLTMDYKVVEAKDLVNLKSIESLMLSKNDVDAGVYICQYCPQAFAKSEYLKTHIQKSHVCKFCTQPFSLTEDLFKHLREVHTEHKCVICLKNLSSHTNLRHHIRRVHRINLPAKVSLIDYIKSTDVVMNNTHNDDEVQIIQEKNAVANLIQILGENNMELT